jgi:hypothetical protein
MIGYKNFPSITPAYLILPIKWILRGENGVVLDCGKRLDIGQKNFYKVLNLGWDNLALQRRSVDLG